jgi:hypothetical protein
MRKQKNEKRLMIEYLINKLFSIIMKDSGKYSYSLKKIREKEIRLYHFIKVKFRLICFRLIRNKKYVCFPGAGGIIESHPYSLFMCSVVGACFSGKGW